MPDLTAYADHGSIPSSVTGSSLFEAGRDYACHVSWLSITYGLLSDGNSERYFNELRPVRQRKLFQERIGDVSTDRGMQFPAPKYPPVPDPGFAFHCLKRISRVSRKGHIEAMTRRARFRTPWQLTGITICFWSRLGSPVQAG